MCLAEGKALNTISKVVTFTELMFVISSFSLAASSPSIHPSNCSSFKPLTIRLSTHLCTCSPIHHPSAPPPTHPSSQVGKLPPPFCAHAYELGPLPRQLVTSPVWPSQSPVPPPGWHQYLPGAPLPAPQARALCAGKPGCLPGEPRAQRAPGTCGLHEGVKTTAHLGPSVSRVTAGEGEGCSQLQELRFHTCAPSRASHTLIPG